jgi:hypothetical protein
MPLRPDRDLEAAREGALELWRCLLESRSAAPGEPAAVSRLELDLGGRYQVGDGNEFACEVPEATPLGLTLKGPKIGRLGDHCLANIDSVGIVEGVVVQAQQQSFVVGPIAPPRRIRRLAERLGWRWRRDHDEVAERRSSQRVEMNSAEGRLETTEGQVYSARIFDVSEGGAALHLGSGALYFWVDQPVTFEGRAGKVLRIFPGGIVIKYE